MNISSPILKNTIIIGEYSVKDALVERNKVETLWNKKVDKKRVLFCGTYPIAQSNGYAKVMYYISKNMGKYDDIEFTVYGFQNFKQTAGASLRNDIPPNIKLHDALATENPKRQGFGNLEIGKFLKENPQDIIIIFNDNLITSALTATIVNELHHLRSKFKLVSYMDQVYPYQKPDYINLLNTHFDAIITFTPYWKDIAYKIGIKKEMPIYFFPHGFDHKLYFPIPINLCRSYYNIDKEAFCMLNINRNQPRKALDLSIISWVEVVKRHYISNVLEPDNKFNFKINKHTRRPIKFLIGTTPNGYWNLYDILEHECKLQEVPYEYAKNTLWFVDNPQQLSDRDINILCNCCDIYINTHLGEGWSLTNFETLALGKAQVVSRTGGVIEYIDETNSIIIEPVLRTYGDLKSKGIGTLSEYCSPKDFTEAIWTYFSNPDLALKHGKKGRQNILQNYRWESMVEHFYKNILNKL